MTHSDSGWHAHLHIIIESAYIPWHEIHSGWKAVSGGSGCHIKAIPGRAIVNYVSKYVTKTELPADLQLQASDALRGRRLYQPFGAWHAPINAINVPVAVCRECGTGVFVYDGGVGYSARTFGTHGDRITEPHYHYHGPP